MLCNLHRLICKQVDVRLFSKTFEIAALVLSHASYSHCVRDVSFIQCVYVVNTWPTPDDPILHEVG